MKEVLANQALQRLGHHPGAYDLLNPSDDLNLHQSATDTLGSGSRVLAAEACSHHPTGEDIGREKVPRWLQQYVGGKLEFTHVQEHDFPEDVTPHDLVVQCGACVWNDREMPSRLLRCRRAGVPITNYGVCIVYTLGIFERALRPFPAALDAYGSARPSRGARLPGDSVVAGRDSQPPAVEPEPTPDPRLETRVPRPRGLPRTRRFALYLTDMTRAAVWALTPAHSVSRVRADHRRRG